MMTRNQEDTSPKLSSGTSGTTSSEPSEDSTIISELIRIEGEIAGQENLTIGGRVKGGTVELNNHHVTVGKTGHLIGDLYGRLISVEGEVQGNLRAEEKIELLPSAVVDGDIQAPVVSIQEGAKFNGMIDMDTGSTRQRSRFVPTPSPELKGV